MLPPCLSAQAEGKGAGRENLLAMLTSIAVLSLIPLASAQAAAPFTVSDLPQVRCVSNYLYGDDSLDVAAWRRDLDRMKRDGFNTVWMVNVWAQFEPSVDPPRWDEGNIAKLREICTAAEARGMWVVLPLAYVGEGWGPKGLDVPVWPLVEKSRKEHLAFLRRMASATKDFPNVFYLLCSEEILPATVLYKPEDRPECVKSFREWARQANPDVGYWNKRWGTDFTWDTLHPANTDHRHRWQQWADNSRWDGWLLRRLLPPMVAAIRQEKPGAVIGYHDFLMPMGLDLTAADGGMPVPSPFDFYSIGYYYDANMKGGLKANLEALHKHVARARQLYPGFPLFDGELGLDVRKKPAEARAAGEKLQAEFLVQATDYLHSQGIGFSLWDWRTVVPGAARTFSLVRKDGTDTPALVRLREVWRGWE